MNAIAALILASTVGVDYGWHRATDGEWEYIIQIEPGLVETLTKGQALVSQMPPELRGVRRFRIQIGQGEVPREPLPPGGIANLANAADPRPAPVGGAGNPLEPAAWGTSWYDFLRQNPIRVEPLENTFLNDPRMRTLEPGRDAWDNSARAGATSSPWNPLSRPGWNAAASGLSNNQQPGAFPPAGNGFSAFPPATTGPGALASGGFGGGAAPDTTGLGIGPDPAPFSSGNRWGNEPLLPQRPRLEFETPEDAAQSSRLRLNDPARAPSRGFGLGAGPGKSLPGSAGPIGFARPTGGQDAANFAAFGPANPVFSAPTAAGTGFSTPPAAAPGFGSLAIGGQGPANPGFATQGFGGQGFGGQGFSAQGFGNAGSSWDASRATGGATRTPSISLAAPGRDSGWEASREPGREAERESSREVGREVGRDNLTATGNRPAARAEIRRSSTQPAAFIQSPTDKIWWPLTMTVLLLFGSLGGNFYLGWLAMDFYRRYRECAWQLRTGP